MRMLAGVGVVLFASFWLTVAAFLFVPLSPAVAGLLLFAAPFSFAIGVLCMVTAAVWAR